MDRGRVGVFIGCFEETNTQFRIWAPDLKRIIKHHAVRFAENEKRGSIELTLPVQPPNVLPAREPVDKPRKTVMWNDAPVGLALANQSGQTDSQPNENAISLQEDSDSNPRSQTWPTNAKPVSKKHVQNFLHIAIPKRVRGNETTLNKIERTHQDKIARAMIALLTQDAENARTNQEWALVSKASSSNAFPSNI